MQILPESRETFPWGFPYWIDQPPIEKNVTISDIKLISCIGDSLLTGLGVISRQDTNSFMNRLGNSSIALFIKWVWSGGEHRNNTCITGDQIISIGRILKHYSPNIIGLCKTKTRIFSNGSSFNFATTGATTRNLSSQIQRLIKKLDKKRYEYLKHEWKAVFVWIGCNDVFGKSYKSLRETYERELRLAIHQLRLGMTKVVVYVLLLPNLTHLSIKNITKSDLDRIDEKTQFVNRTIERVVQEVQNTKEFLVKYIPIPGEKIPSASQADLISQIDNIHPSILAQELFAKAIWNNMVSDQHFCTLKEVVHAPWLEPPPDSILFSST